MRQGLSLRYYRDLGRFRIEYVYSLTDLIVQGDIVRDFNAGDCQSLEAMIWTQCPNEIAVIQKCMMAYPYRMKKPVDQREANGVIHQKVADWLLTNDAPFRADIR